MAARLFSIQTKNNEGESRNDGHMDTPYRVPVTNRMEFFSEAISVLSTLVIALGAGLGVWGVVNLLEGYGSGNPGAKSQGIKQLMSGGGVILIGSVLIPLLSGLFS